MDKLEESTIPNSPAQNELIDKVKTGQTQKEIALGHRYESKVFAPEFIPFNLEIHHKYKLSYLETLIYGFIKFYTSFKPESFYFTNKHLADMFGISEVQISKSISKLVGVKLIEATYHFKKYGGRMRYIKLLDKPDINKSLSKELTKVYGHNNKINNNKINNTNGVKTPLDSKKNKTSDKDKKYKKRRNIKVGKDKRYIVNQFHKAVGFDPMDNGKALSGQLGYMLKDFKEIAENTGRPWIEECNDFFVWYKNLWNYRSIETIASARKRIDKWLSKDLDEEPIKIPKEMIASIEDYKANLEKQFPKGKTFKNLTDKERKAINEDISEIIDFQCQVYKINREDYEKLQRN